MELFTFHFQTKVAMQNKCAWWPMLLGHVMETIWCINVNIGQKGCKFWEGGSVIQDDCVKAKLYSSICNDCIPSCASMLFRQSQK